MGKYLKDKYLDSVLENYFNEADESVYEKFKTKKDIINYLKKIYKNDPDYNKKGVSCIQTWRNDGEYNARNVWINDLYYMKVTESEIVDIMNSSSAKHVTKEYIGYENELNKDDEKDIKKILDVLNKTDLVLLAHDGGGTEFSIDKKTKLVYLYDHDWQFIPIGLSIKEFLNLGK